MLGELLSSLTPQGQSPSTPETSSGLGSNLVSTLERPDTRAFLTNFGLQLMTPSYTNNPWGSVASAIGAGYEGMAGVQKMEQAAADRSAAAGRQGQARQDKLNDDERNHEQALELEGMKQEGATTRKGMSGGAKGSGGLSKAQELAAVQKEMKLLRDENFNRKSADRMSEDQIEEMARARVGRLTGQGNPTSANPAGASAPVGTGGPGKTPKPTSQISDNSPMAQSAGKADPNNRQKVGKFGVMPQAGKVLPSGVKEDPRWKDKVYRDLWQSKGYNVN